MYDHNQTLVPESFLHLFSVHGRPTLARAETEARYEACEDLALHVAALCEQKQQGPNDAAVALRRCHDGLITPAASTSRAEAVWVVRRVAELLGWAEPAWLVELGERRAD